MWECGGGMVSWNFKLFDLEQRTEELKYGWKTVKTKCFWTGGAITSDKINNNDDGEINYCNCELQDFNVPQSWFIGVESVLGFIWLSFELMWLILYFNMVVILIQKAK